jgi:hydroxyethylthiazole kinase-like sugar kinase family protein
MLGQIKKAKMEDYTIYTETYFLSSDRTHVKVFDQVSKVKPRHKHVESFNNHNNNSVTLKGNTKEINSFISELSFRGVDSVRDADS